MGAERQLSASPAFVADRAELAELCGRHDQLKRMETQEKNRMAKTTSRMVRADISYTYAPLRGVSRGLRLERFDLTLDHVAF